MLLAALLASFVFAPQALAATPANVLDGDLTCGQVTAEGNVSTSLGQVWCGSQPASITSTLDTPLPVPRSTHKTFDGVPLDVNFALPSTGTAPYPVVGIYHGYGGGKFSFSQMQRWLDKGYATYSISQRGMSESCRSAGSQAADPTGCANGYTHLMDQRYEVRDTQIFLGELVDQGLVAPTKIAATGGSYGGGMSMSLAALKNRMMMPNGNIVPWTSPDGTPMSLAVASPNIPWTELTYALAPNGNNIDYIKDASYFGRTGVMKESYVQGLITQARNAPEDQGDPSADLLGWKALLDAGEPYDSKPAIAAMKAEINTYHSSYGIPHDQAPAPMLISSGFTDDLFPVNEATRYYNRTRAQFPSSPLGLFFGSFGHARGQNQGHGHERPQHARGAVGRPLPGRRGPPARIGRDDLHADVPRRDARRRTVQRSGLGVDLARRDPDRQPRRADDRCRWWQHRGRYRVEPGEQPEPVHDDGRSAGAGYRQLRDRPGAGSRLHRDGCGDDGRQVHGSR